MNEMELAFDVVVIVGIPAIIIGSAGILYGIFGRFKAFDDFVERLFK